MILVAIQQIAMTSTRDLALTSMANVLWHYSEREKWGSNWLQIAHPARVKIP